MAIKHRVIRYLSLFLRSRLASLLLRVVFRKPVFVITTHPGALLGNQLTIFAHVIACALERGREIWTPSFFSYAKHFESTSRDLFTRFPERRSVLYPSQSLRVLLYYYVFARLVRVLFLSPDPPVKDVALFTDYERKRSLDSVDLLSEKRRIVILEGYFFRTAGVRIKRHSAVIKYYFRPLKRHEVRASALVGQARVGAQVLVGVHLRQFDAVLDNNPHPLYQFQHAQQMTQAMRRTAECFRGKIVKFLLFSNGEIKRSLFSDFSTAVGSGHIAEDLHALSLCDYILASTYSTYSRWASFYGDVPLYQVDDPTLGFSLRDFRVQVPGFYDPTNESGPIQV